MQTIIMFGLSVTNAQTPLRARIDFDEGWKFKHGHAADATKDFNYSIANLFAKSGKTDNTPLAVKFNDSGWRSIDLPHDWAVELPFERSVNFDVMAHGYKPVGGLFPQNSIGWYRKPFRINAADSGQRFTIQFDGIFRDAKIWLNGFYLGNNESGYVGITYDITDYINFHGNNMLVVRADASQYEGWFYEGAGIYRHVWLNKFSNLHVDKDEIFVRSKVNNNAAILSIDVPVKNMGGNFPAANIQSYLIDRQGKKVSTVTSQFFQAGSDVKQLFKLQVNVNNPVLWSIENPYLYRVITVLKAGEQTLDSFSTRIGIRTIEIKPDGVFLNGKYVKLKGVNCHQDHAGVGSALPDYLQYYRVKLLKELGVNAYRSSHNAPTPELLEACDSLGMLVMDEQRLLNSSPEYMDQFERLIKRDRNHASVFMWSIGNEEGWIQTNSVGKRLALSLVKKQQELDPSRTSTYAADVANVFHGVNEVIPVRGFNYRQFAVADYHRDHPNQPIIGTEMGSTVTTRGIYEKDSARAYVPDQDITAPWWASTAETWWTLAADNPAWLGGFVWTGFDYRGEPTPYEWPNINSHFGIMDMCGFPKNIYYYYQSWWKDEDVIHISPHWNWPGKEGQLIDVWVNSNAADVELFLNGKSLGRQSMPRNRHLKWQVPYSPGKLQATGTKSGKKISTYVETTGDPHTLKLTPDRVHLLANGKDATVINVSVLDQSGREVPDAMNEINFSLTGKAAVIGTGNGDPSSHEADKCFPGQCKRKLFNGKCQLIIQSGKSAGLIKVEARAAGLMPASTEIIAQQ